VPQVAEEILDWYHLIENLHKVGGSLKRLQEAESLLWEGQVDKTIALFDSVKTAPSRRFQAYLQTHRSRIPNYRYYQMEGLPIGSGPYVFSVSVRLSFLAKAGTKFKVETKPLNG
jgi:hypothetical protein